MQFNNSLCNCQSHARALNDYPLISISIKLLTNHFLIDVIHSLAVICHTCNEFGISKFDCDMYGRLWRGVFAGVLPQMDDDFCKSYKIHPHQRQILRDVHFHWVALKSLS